MGFKANGFATVWETKAGNGNYTDVRLSTSKKNKQTEQYENDFSGFVRFVGAAHQKAATLKPKDRIKLGDCEVTNKYDKVANTTYTNYVVFDFEASDASSNNQQQNSGKSSASTSHAASSFVDVPNDLDGDDLPFN